MYGPKSFCGGNETAVYSSSMGELPYQEVGGLGPGLKFGGGNLGKVT